MWVKAALLCTLCAAACQRQNPLFDSDSDANTTGCTLTCTAPLAVCNEVSGTCVECLSDNSCDVGKPVCGEDHSCRGCATHEECASGVCRQDGSCATEDMVAHVDSAALGSIECTYLSPCASINAALDTGRAVIYVRGSLTERVLITRDVELVAEPGTLLSSDGVVSPITIKTSGEVRISDISIFGNQETGINIPTGDESPLVVLRRVEITGASTGIVQEEGHLILDHVTIATCEFSMQPTSLEMRNSRILDNQNGITMFSGRGLVIEDSVVARNGQNGISAHASDPSGQFALRRTLVAENQGVGVTAEFQYVDIVSNIVVRNQGAGLVLSSLQGKVDFNTVADNSTRSGVAGIDCKLSLSPTRNLVFRNRGGAQTGGGCPFAANYIDVGDGDLDNSLMLVSPNSQPFDYHLTADTPSLIRGAVASGCIGTDFDGDDRSAETCDIGADQFVPKM